MRLPEQIFEDLAKIDEQRKQLDAKEKGVLQELAEIHKVVEERLATYKAVNKI